MIEARLTLFGEQVLVHYQMHDSNYIDWYVDSTELSNEHYDWNEIEQVESIHSMLETILRANYTSYVETKIREQYYWHMEEKARAYPPDEVF